MNEKTIFLIRHAKAEDSTLLKSDFDRQLKSSGKKKAKEIAGQLKDKINFESNTIVLSSSAQRAIETAIIFCQEWSYPIQRIIQLDTIYEAHYLTILSEINKLPNTVDTVILFGHNPGLSSLTNYLCSTYITLTTAAAAEIRLEENLNFSELSAETAYLKHVFDQ